MSRSAPPILQITVIWLAHSQSIIACPHHQTRCTLFNVSIRRDISFGELSEIAKKGGSVTRTPHVGNLYPANLACLSMGIPALVYDMTIGKLDDNYHPHFCITGNWPQAIGPENVFLSHAKVTSSPQIFSNFFPEGGRIADGHMAALREAFPKADIMSFSEWLRANYARLLPLLTKISETMPSLWERYVLKNGHVEDESVTVTRHQYNPILGVTDDFGWVVPLPCTIAFQALLEAIDKKTSQIWHLSGPDMFKYIMKLKDKLDAIYSIARELYPELPEELEYNVVPVSDLRLVVPKKEEEGLNRLLEIYTEYKSAQAVSSTTMGTEGFRATRAMRSAEGKILDAIRGCTTPFYRIETKKYFTQYDLLNEGSQLYIHPWMIENTIEKVIECMEYLKGRATKVIQKQHAMMLRGHPANEHEGGWVKP